MINSAKLIHAIRTHGPVSIWPIAIGTFIYLDWSKTQKYKARKAAENSAKYAFDRE